MITRTRIESKIHGPVPKTFMNVIVSCSANAVTGYDRCDDPQWNAYLPSVWCSHNLTQIVHSLYGARRSERLEA